jgi:hypothetical protein
MVEEGFMDWLRTIVSVVVYVCMLVFLYYMYSLMVYLRVKGSGKIEYEWVKHGKNKR